MDWSPVEIVAGILLAAATLLDVFATVVVPGRVSGTIKIPMLLRAILFPAWRAVARMIQRRNPPEMGSMFAAFVLLAVFITWVLLLLAALALVAIGLSTSFTPALRHYPEALYQIGSAMMTLGMNGHNATGWARMLPVTAGLCGLLVITLTLTFIVQVQTALRDRDALVIKLVTRAGTPPSGIRLLCKMRELGLDDGLPDMFDNWEDWVAALLHTHAAHPVLVYFRSDEVDSDWITALGAVLDAASLAVGAIQDCPRGNARLFYDIGSRAARQIATQFRLDIGGYKPDPVSVAKAHQALSESGFRLQPLDHAKQTVGELRGGYAAAIAALACHFGVDVPDWAVGRPPDQPQAIAPPSER